MKYINNFKIFESNTSIMNWYDIKSIKKIISGVLDITGIEYSFFTIKDSEYHNGLLYSSDIMSFGFTIDNIEYYIDVSAQISEKDDQMYDPNNVEVYLYNVSDLSKERVEIYNGIDLLEELTKLKVPPYMKKLNEDIDLSKTPYRNKDQYWETSSEVKDIVNKILNMFNIKYDIFYNKEDDIDNLLEYDDIIEWDFKISNFDYSIVIVGEETEVDGNILYDGSKIIVYFFTLSEDDPNFEMDSQILESGLDLTKLLLKYTNSMSNKIAKQLNENKYIQSYKIFESNRFINFRTFDLKKWYDKLNKQYFNNKLPNVPLRWNQTTKEVGVVKWNTKTKEIYHLGISDKFKYTESEILSILTHEMIHIWQIKNNKVDGHGKYFIKEMDRINDKSKWGINVMPVQPMAHMKMENPDLNKDVHFIIIKDSEKFKITIFDDKKVDYKLLLINIKNNLKSKIDYEYRITRNGVIKQYDKMSTDKKMSIYDLDELTFNTLMNSSKKVKGGEL